MSVPVISKDPPTIRFLFNSRDSCLLCLVAVVTPPSLSFPLESYHTSSVASSPFRARVAPIWVIVLPFVQSVGVVAIQTHSAPVTLALAPVLAELVNTSPATKVVVL